MKRTMVLFVLAVGGLVAALLLPHTRRAAPPSTPDVSSPVLVAPTAPVPTAGGSLTLRARPTRQVFLAGGDDLDVVYEITAARPAGTERRAVDFALVFDRSGSMTGEPLAKAKAAALSLVDRLEPTDRLGVIHFGSDAVLALPITAMDGPGRIEARRAIERIDADGGTNTSSALELAERALREAPAHEAAIRRIVLLSDGEANEGIVGTGLVQIVREQDTRGLRLSALGLGTDFDEELMMAMADAGGGQYRYLRDADEVASALSTELAQAAATAATGLTLTLTPEEGIEIRDTPGVTAEQADRLWRLGLNDIAAGETRRVTLRLHATSTAEGSRPLVDARLAYTDVLAGHTARMANARASATASHDASAVAQSYDVDAARVALRARWGSTMMATSQEYRHNDVAQATTRLQASLNEISTEAAALHDGALRQELSDESRDATKMMNAAPAASPQGSAFGKTFSTKGREYTR